MKKRLNKKARKTKVAKTPKKEVRLTLVNFKANETEASRLQANADRYAKGNLSKWLRASGLNFVPPKKLLTNKAA